MGNKTPIITKNRLEAFSDGFFAIVITIMVLEMKVPHGTDLGALMPVLPVFMSYVLSFLYLGIYWNNHHHLVASTSHVSGGMMWANLHLLFWLSLIPFVTGWMGENSFAPLPTAFYGGVLFMAGIAYFILQHLILSTKPENSPLRLAIGRDFKGKISPVLYIAGIVLTFVTPIAAGILYLLVALMWIIPDKRIEKALADEKGK